MARPRVKDENKRIVQVNIRLTEDEHKKVAQYSEACGLSPANWMRRKVFSGKFPPLKLSPLDASIYRELKMMGINLNQIAHRLNQGSGYDGDVNFMIRILGTLKDILKKLTNDRQPG